MQVFDNFERTDHTKASHSECLFPFLNRSASPLFATTRNEIEKWYSKYPLEHASELRSRIRSSDNHDSEGAIFELALHEILLQLGCTIEIHPEVPEGTRVPDFLVCSSEGDSFYMEATLATFKSDKKVASEARINQVFDAINRQVNSTDFFLDLEISDSPKTPPNAKKISKGINKWLANLDPDEVSRIYEETGFDGVPRWEVRHEGWFIIVRPIPKKKSSRGLPSESAIGMVGTGVRSVDHRTPLRKALESKSTAYGNLKYPYVIAVNVLEHVDDIDIMEALFGKESWSIHFNKETGELLHQPEMSRIPDGFWTKYAGPRNTRVSCVLIFLRFKIWDLKGEKVRLYHNPWAKMPYSSVLTKFPQAIPKETRMYEVGGIDLQTILG